ncbi:MAG: hypothetical protein AAF614_35755 [Chloroflexota bacterium]
MKHHITNSISHIADHPYLNLVVGLILLYTGLNEAWSTIAQDIQTMNFGAHHGLVVFGLVGAFKAFSHLKKGVD